MSSIVCVYVFPTVPGPHFENAVRFISSYIMNPAGADHRLVVVSNGGPPTVDMQALIAMLPIQAEIFIHDNSGWDIGAFQAAAHAYPCDMMVFFGTTAYLRGPGWLRRMVEAFEHRGKAGLYGSTANQGNPGVGVFPHIRTTGFWLSPAIMNMYPLRVTDPSQRYPAEHGPHCLTEWCRAQGYRAWMVAWNGEYEWPYWDSVQNGYHQGNQSNLIVGDRMTAPPFYAWP
jgi:hypothetical protein